jgi:hypothetical protein
LTIANWAAFLSKDGTTFTNTRRACRLPQGEVGSGNPGRGLPLPIEHPNVLPPLGRLWIDNGVVWFFGLNDARRQ